MVYLILVFIIPYLFSIYFYHLSFRFIKRKFKQGPKWIFIINLLVITFGTMLFVTEWNSWLRIALAVGFTMFFLSIISFGTCIVLLRIKRVFDDPEQKNWRGW